LKREDLNHTGAHKINNTIGQAMLAKRMGKPRIIAETGAGQHGVATATICARYGLECVVYMGSEDVKRQSPNVYRMKLLGATVVPVESGSKTLKDALNEAMRDWVANVDNTFYIIGTVAGPHPYPMMVRDFQSVIGEECLTQMPEMFKTLKMAEQQPDAELYEDDHGWPQTTWRVRKTVAMAVAMKTAVATSERIESRDRPQTPWPEVQPLPHTAPKPTSRPASASSGALASIRGIGTLPVTKAATSGETTIPSTKAIRPARPASV
jgi:hypothetical protein